MNEATFWEHCSELRQLMLKALIAIIIASCCALFFHKEILFSLAPKTASTHQDLQTEEVRYKRIHNPTSKAVVYTLKENEFIQVPFEQDYLKNIKTLLIASNQSIDIGFTAHTPLVALGPIEGIVTSFKLSFYIGIVLASPYWLYLLIQFIVPALTKIEKQRFFPGLAFLLAFLILGGLFAYFITLPLANSYLQSFNEEIATNLWSISAYTDYLITLILANGFAFELAAILILLVHFEKISVEKMVAYRRHMIVVTFILGALLTPPDVPSQVMLAIPLICLYELTILYARLRSRWAERRLTTRRRVKRSYAQ